MEPLTAVTMIVAKYGITALVGALTGNKDLGGVAAELMGALTASEDRLGEQLGKIGRQLDEVLQQPYSTAIAAGRRTLRDAGTTSDPQIRIAELTRARHLFRDAAAAARSSLQEAVAERYVVLSSIALGRWDSVPAALEIANRTAFEALIGALPLVGSQAYGRAAAQLAREGRAGRLWRREERIEVLTHEIVGAAMEVVHLALGLIEEIRTLADELGHHPQPPKPEIALHLPEGYDKDDRPARTARVVISPAQPGPVQFGPLQVAWTWHDGHLPATPPPPLLPWKVRGDSGDGDVGSGDDGVIGVQETVDLADPQRLFEHKAQQIANKLQENELEIRDSEAKIQQAGLLLKFLSAPSLDMVAVVRTAPALSVPLRLSVVSSPAVFFENPELPGVTETGIPAGFVNGDNILQPGEVETQAGNRFSPDGGQNILWTLRVNDVLHFQTSNEQYLQLPPIPPTEAPR